jgi:hypothetical protein
VEKQLHAAIGAKHKTSLNGEQKDRTPSVHSLFLSVEGFRKRLRNLEEIEGATQCARFLKQLQVNGTQIRGENIAPTSQVAREDRIVSTQQQETIDEELETAEEILARQAELT